jgi:hypothetical protein
MGAPAGGVTVPDEPDELFVLAAGALLFEPLPPEAAAATPNPPRASPAASAEVAINLRGLRWVVAGTSLGAGPYWACQVPVTDWACQVPDPAGPT